MVAFLGGCGPTAEHYNQKGAESFNQKDLAAAKAEFQKAIFFNGQNPAYHNNLGYVLYQLKDYDGAEAEFEKALVDHPGESLLRQIQIDQALLYCDSNAAGKPSHKDWNGKGITVLKELLEKDPNNAELHMRLGFAYFQGANPGGGFSELNKAVQLATPEMTAHYTQQPAQGALMILKEIQGFYAKIRYFKKVQEIQKDITKIEKEIKISPTKTS
jgi:tetratricopeptide (TPR) repeat protein